MLVEFIFGSDKYQTEKWMNKINSADCIVRGVAFADVDFYHAGVL